MKTAWVTGKAVSREGLAQYTHLIRSPSDPERSPRPKGGREDRAPHRTLGKRTRSDLEALILKGLEDGEARTFNRLGVEVFDLTADVLFTTPVNSALWDLVRRGQVEHTLKAPIMFRRRKEGVDMDQEQEHGQQQQDQQEGEDLLKMLGVEEGEGEEEGEGGGEGESSGDDTQEVDAGADAGSGPLLSLTEISRLTGIMYVTLKRYAVLHDSTDLTGLWEGEGRNKKYHPEAVEVFRRLKAESKKGRKPQQGQRSAPDTAPGRGGVQDPLPPTPPAQKGGKGSGSGSGKGGKDKKKAKEPAMKKGAGKKAGAPLRVHPESVPSSATTLSTQEADRAMAAIERVQLMARYEAVKEMVGPWVKEMERLEKVLGLGEAMR